MTTSIRSEAQKIRMDIGQNFTIEQCNTMNIKHDKIGKQETFKITQPFKITKT